VECRGHQGQQDGGLHPEGCLEIAGRGDEAGYQARFEVVGGKESAA
jgi:hypothetical protein